MVEGSYGVHDACDREERRGCSCADAGLVLATWRFSRAGRREKRRYLPRSCRLRYRRIRLGLYARRTSETRLTSALVSRFLPSSLRTSRYWLVFVGAIGRLHVCTVPMRMLLTALGPQGWVRFLSRRGCMQGCPAGPLCFAAALQRVNPGTLGSSTQCLIITLHDDLQVAGPPDLSISRGLRCVMLLSARLTRG